MSTQTGDRALPCALAELVLKASREGPSPSVSEGWMNLLEEIVTEHERAKACGDERWANAIRHAVAASIRFVEGGDMVRARDVLIKTYVVTEKLRNERASRGAVPPRPRATASRSNHVGLACRGRRRSRRAAARARGSRPRTTASRSRGGGDGDAGDGSGSSSGPRPLLGRGGVR